MQNQSARGILYLCFGVFIFSLQDAIIKQVSGGYPLTEVVCIRSCVGLPILLALVQKEVGWRALYSTHLAQLALRALIMLGAYTAYYMAFPALPLADAVALYFTVPLFVTGLAGPFLGEHIGWKVWAAVLLGFVGVLVMLQPGTGLFNPAALLSLRSAALYGTAMLMARKMGNRLPTSVMAFYQNGFFLVGSAFAAGLLHVSIGLELQHVVRRPEEERRARVQRAGQAGARKGGSACRCTCAHKGNPARPRALRKSLHGCVQRAGPPPPEKGEGGALAQEVSE